MVRGHMVRGGGHMGVCIPGVLIDLGLPIFML